MPRDLEPSMEELNAKEEEGGLADSHCPWDGGARRSLPVYLPLTLART